MILTPERLALEKRVADNLTRMLTKMMWAGKPLRVFFVVTGPLHNNIRRMGPDTKFGGLDHLIQTAKDMPIQ